MKTSTFIALTIMFSLLSSAFTHEVQIYEHEHIHESIKPRAYLQLTTGTDPMSGIHSHDRIHNLLFLQDGEDGENKEEQGGKITILKDKECDPSSSIVFKTKKLENPATVAKGDFLMFKQTGIFTKEVNASKSVITALLNGEKAQDDIVVTLDKTFKAGEQYSVEYKRIVPSIIPAGDFLIKVNIFDNEGKAVSCLQATFKINKTQE